MGRCIYRASVVILGFGRPLAAPTFLRCKPLHFPKGLPSPRSLRPYRRGRVSRPGHFLLFDRGKQKIYKNFPITACTGENSGVIITVHRRFSTITGSGSDQSLRMTVFPWCSIGTVYNNTVVTYSGLLASSHLVGAKAMSDALKSGVVICDGNGVPAHEYMELFAGYDISEV